MKLVVVSHKLCWADPDSASGYATDGGFPLQMSALSELFESTRIAVPCLPKSGNNGVSPLTGNEVAIAPLSLPEGKGIMRKLNIPIWFARNGRRIWKEVRKADAVHAPIPGDVGTVGIVFALIQRKPLFVRHCGNWFVQTTSAERIWKWGMERFAGGRNVMLATGGSDKPPSAKNPKVEWIFSTSLRKQQIANNLPRKFPKDGEINLVIACRQEERKGTDVVIDAMPKVLEQFPKATLDVVGDGSLLPSLRERTEHLGISDRVRFHGKVAQADVLAILDRANVFCYPTAASEGFPKVVLEALASGLPVITTPVSVLPVLMANGCGILLDEPTPSLLADAIGNVLSDSARYEHMSVKALEVAKQYSLENWRDVIGATLRAAWKVPSLS